MADPEKPGETRRTMAERDADWQPSPYVSGEARPRGAGSIFDPNANAALTTGPAAFVTGWPVWHSRSPMIHSTWLADHGIAGSYKRVGVPPEEIFDFLKTLRAAGYVGGNVTIPHKEAAFAAADAHDAAAQAIGAVNSLWFDGDRLIGGNTDAYGFSANLDEKLAGWDSAERAVVIGAGGAARAVIHALLSRGIASVAVVNRTEARAKALVDSFGPKVTAHPMEDRDAMLASADLLVNTAPVPPPDPDEERMPAQFHVKQQADLSMMKDGALVTDIVYAPLMTPTLAGAKARDLRFADGLGMLLHQAVPGFERWFGVKPNLTPELRAKILRDVEAGS